MHWARSPLAALDVPAGCSTVTPSKLSKPSRLRLGLAHYRHCSLGFSLYPKHVAV